MHVLVLERCYNIGAFQVMSMCVTILLFHNMQYNYYYLKRSMTMIFYTSVFNNRRCLAAQTLVNYYFVTLAETYLLFPLKTRLMQDKSLSPSLFFMILSDIHRIVECIETVSCVRKYVSCSFSIC